MKARISLCVRISAAVLALGVGVASAQSVSPLDPKEFAARSITRLALFDLRATQRPSENDYRIAAQLLAIAHDFTPNDPEILRCRLEAAYACGDDDRVLELTRELLNADPKDTVSQLRLITASIAKNNQNGEDRVRAYERFLDPEGPGKAIDPSVLSRLALDEALLLRERGDDAGFIRKLSQATKLDSTHKEAAQLAATVYGERHPEDRIGCLRMIENVLMADPVDANLHLSIAYELVAGGAFKAAERFIDNAYLINSTSGAPTERLRVEAYVLRWRSHGPADVVAQLNRDLGVARDNAEQEFRKLKDKEHPPERMLKPEDVRLNPALRFLYITALDAAGENEATAAALAELAKDIAKATAELRRSVDKGELTADQAARASLENASQVYILRLLTGHDIDAVRTEITAPDLFDQISPDLGSVIAGWLAIRSNDLAGGRERLMPLIDTMPLALVGVGLSYELAGERTQAIAMYQRVSRTRPLDVMGAWSSSRAAGLGYTVDPKEIAALEAVANDIPAFVDHLVERPQDYQQLRVEGLEPRPDAIDRATLRVSLQNLSRIPMALGPDRPLSSRLLVAPKLEAASMLPTDLVQPEVVDLDRRLRLMPQERVEIEFWPDPGQTGWLMESVASTSLRLRWRIIQGFQIAPGSGYNPGVMGLAADSDSVVRRPLAEASLPPEALASMIGSEPATAIPRLAAAVRASALRPIFAPAAKEAPEKNKPDKPEKAEVPPVDTSKLVAEAFAARYPKLPVMERAMLAAVLPHAKLSPAMAPVDQVMRAENDPIPLCVVLATRVVDPSDELLAKCKDSEDQRVRDIAERIRRRLESGAKCYAKLAVTEIRPVAPEKPAEPPAAKPDGNAPPPGGDRK